MGLFDKFKKKDNNEGAGADHLSQEGVISEAAKGNAANSERGFTLLVEDTFNLKDNTGIVVVGTVHGVMTVGDAAYVLHPGNAITTTTIGGIEVAKDERSKVAIDQPIGLMLPGIKDKSQIAKYSVITSIHPQTVVDVNTAVENPYILGMSLEYSRFANDPEFSSLLVYKIAHGHYLAPMRLDKEPDKNPDGTCTFKEGATMGFISLKSNDEKGDNVFPVFTDWRTLGNWKQLFDNDNPPKTMIFSFPDCVTLTKKGNEGMVINPFGPSSIYVPMSLIDSVINSEGYKQEFVDKSDTQVKQYKVDKDIRIMVGVPQETNEVALIRENMTAYGIRTTAIEKIYLLLKIDENNERTYLCVVDCPREATNKIFGEIYKAVGAYMQETKIMDFMLYESAGSMHNALDEKALVYSK